MLLKIRFHGRGGHGVKTAARIVGTAAFLAGYQAQDAPIYGAERRGAAVAAFVRIIDEPILERGPIAAPDLIVLADETLLRDAFAGELRGQDRAAAIFVNAPEAIPPPTEFDIRPRVVSWDISDLTEQVLGRASALSAGLAGAASQAGTPWARCGCWEDCTAAGPTKTTCRAPPSSQQASERS